MWDDGYPSSRPVVVNATSSDVINSLYDSITFSKGSAILRMLESIVGETNFQSGLRV